MRASFVLAIILLATSSLSAQTSGLDPDIGNPGLGGESVIQGRIFYPSGSPLDRRVRVRVQSVRGGPSSVSSDDNGAFTLVRLQPGTYELTVDAGSDFEPANESVEVRTNGQVAYVQMRLKPKNYLPGRPPGVVNAALAGIPQPALDLYQQALASSQSGDHKKAIDQLKKALSVAPEFVLAMNEMGMQYVKVNDLDKAADSLQKAVKSMPDAFVPRLNYGLVLLLQKKFADAEKELRAALLKSETSAPAHEYLGRVLIGLKRLDEAELELKRSIELGGEQAVNSHRYLGALYMQRGEDARAIVELQEYLRLAPKVKDADQIKQILKDLGAKEPRE
ncbi:MAG TPA: tetratricopeptide repeat protein [Pyrinomonadaceae bacterium]|nr:tetratricopeptide repeat protein [Pyrinomonadaceae bacterium]